MTAARRGGMRSWAWKRRRRERKSLMGTAERNSVRPATSSAERLAALSSFCRRRACSAQREERESATGIRQRPLRVWCLQPPSGEASCKGESLTRLELIVVVLMLCLDFLRIESKIEIFWVKCDTPPGILRKSGFQRSCGDGFSVT